MNSAVVGVVLVLIALFLVIPQASAAPLQQGGVHVVQRGETLGQIALAYGVSSAAIANANGISNPNFIYAGQRLVIPGASSGQSTGGSFASSAIYVVQPGENLSTIAARHGTSTAALAQANGISNPNHIYAGQVLQVPATGSTAVANDSYSVPAQPVVAPAPAPAAGSGGGRWIDIDLRTQTLTAYEGSTPLLQRLVSTGLSFPTPEGTYSILYKVRSQRMTGPGYDLPNVPWVMYFTNRGHAIHGAYWHNNFGSPMSHGCVNMRPEDAEWLYNFASTGTQVVVHS